MDFSQRHPWDLTPSEAITLQKELAQELRLQPLPPNLRLIAACDVSFNKGSDDLFAAIVVLDRQDFAVVEEVTVHERISFPYVPGLLSFRELPILMKGFAQLQNRPDVVICDGQGIAHPRRLGIASHLGLWLNIPTIGSAKSLLCGRYEEPDQERGSRTPIVHRRETIGFALRSRSHVKPIFVSPGHLADLDSSTDFIYGLLDKYRIPPPIRHVHNLSNAVRREGAPSVMAFHSVPVLGPSQET